MILLLWSVSILVTFVSEDITILVCSWSWRSFTVQYITYYDGKQDVSSWRQLHRMKALRHGCQPGLDSITEEHGIYCK